MTTLNTPETFWNGVAANGHQIDKVLRHHGSPLVGQGELIARVSREEGVNPILLLAIMQEETRFGMGDDRSVTKVEYIVNPFAVHFAPEAKGIAKLRLPHGEPCTFEQSLRATVRQLKQAARNARAPLTRAAQTYNSLNAHWANNVDSHFSRLMKYI